MGRIEVRDFDGDLEALEAMTRESFRQEYGDEPWLDLYRPEMARHIFSDVPDPRFLIAAYDGAKLVGFVANLPRRYRFNGSAYLGVASTMLVSHKDYQGAAVYLIAECLSRNEELATDFALMFFEHGHRAGRIFEQVLKPRFRIERLKRMYMIIHSIDLAAIAVGQHLKPYHVAGLKLLGAQRPIVAPAVPGTVRPYQDTDLDEILALTRRYSDANCLVRAFEPGPLARRLHTENLTSTAVYERDGAVAGFVNLAVQETIGPAGKERWAWLDFLYWEGLSGKEKRALLAGLWEAGRDRGCIGIMEWNKGYYGQGPLFRARFVPYPRFIDLNAWVFRPDLSLRGVGKIFDQVI
jgi:hypothetical protein